MPLHLKGNKKGLLWTGDFGAAVDAELPQYDVSRITDSRLLTALFRDYTFAASAYLLEPCDIQFRKDKTYGLGRNVLPRNLAVPLYQVAEKMGAYPFMEYAQSYSLYNWRKKSANGPLTYDNLDIIRAFGGQPSEHGFILIHVAMVAFTGDQVKYTVEAMKAVEQGNREAFNQACAKLSHTMRLIQNTMETMWTHSKPEVYNDFRTFIMGTKSQPMFPDGVLYEGVFTERKQYRGESGANDNIIPTLDNFLQLTENMPDNPLTQILRDFRSYRPKNHRDFVDSVEVEAKRLNVRKFALEDSESALLYLELLDHIREFRNRHWQFTKSYILAHTKHAVATGGSPITTYLPNQLRACLDAMVQTVNQINLQKLDKLQQKKASELGKLANVQRRVLDREVENFKPQYSDQDVNSAQRTT